MEQSTSNGRKKSVLKEGIVRGFLQHKEWCPVKKKKKKITRTWETLYGHLLQRLGAVWALRTSVTETRCCLKCEVLQQGPTEHTKLRNQATSCQRTCPYFKACTRLFRTIYVLQSLNRTISYNLRTRLTLRHVIFFLLLFSFFFCSVTSRLRFVFTRDIILSGWLGLNHQLTN